MVELADVKSYLGISNSDTSEDALLETLIAAAQGAIEAHTGRSFVATQAERSFGREDVRGAVLHLDADLIALDEVYDAQGTILLQQLRLEPRNTPPYRSLRLIDRLWNPGPEDYIGVSGMWGYSETPPLAVVQAAREYIHFLYHAPEQRESNRPGAPVNYARLPEHIVMMLAPFRQRF